MSSTTYEDVKTVMRTCRPDNVKRKNLHITLIGAGIGARYRRLLEDLCQPAHCQYLPCSSASESIVRTLDQVKKMVITRRTTVTIEVEQSSRDANLLLPGLKNLIISDPSPRARGRGNIRGLTPLTRGGDATSRLRSSLSAAATSARSAYTSTSTRGTSVSPHRGGRGGNRGGPGRGRGTRATFA